MNNSWYFAGELAWRWPTALACILLAVLIAWLEFRKKRPNAWLRVLLSWLAIVALLLAAWQPAYREVLETRQAILLTDNFTRQSLDSLMESNPQLQVFSLVPQAEEGQMLPHPSYLQEELASGSSLFVLGDGPPPSTLSFLEGYSLVHIPGSSKTGLRSLSFSSHLRQNDTLQLHGSWQHLEDSVRIKLSLAGELLDSATVYPDSQSFSLSHIPRLSGQLQYLLWAERKESDTLEQLMLPVRVAEPSPLQLAFFTGYPSFESKYLKNWLAKEGHAVFYQAEMAPDRYVREWLNLPDKSLTGLNKKLLRAVDLLVVDQAYFTGLSLSNQQKVEAAVAEGLGLLVLGNGSSLNWQQHGWKRLPALSMTGRIQEERVLAGTGSVDGAALLHYQAEGQGWYGRKSQEEGKALLHLPFGLGKVGVNLVVDSYPLVLKSKNEAYAQHWSTQLNTLARSSVPVDRLNAEFPAFVGQPQQLVVWQTGKEEPQLVLAEPNGQKQVLPLIQDSRVPERWFATHWPKEKGVYRLSWPGVDSLRFQVFDTAALPAWRQHEKKRLLQAIVSNSKESGKFESAAIQEQPIRYREQAVSQYWFYLLFLISLSGLWVERKLNAR